MRVSTFLAKATATVNMPTLPINIDRIRIDFPESLRLLVIPLESPTVMNAEICSKRISINGKSSVIVRMIDPEIKNKRCEKNGCESTKYDTVGYGSV